VSHVFLSSSSGAMDHAACTFNAIEFTGFRCRRIFFAIVKS